MKKLLILPLLLAMVVATGHSMNALANTIISWGVTPNTVQQTPAVPKNGDTLLQKYDGIYVKDTTKNEVYLTFDLGYEAGFTSEILDILQQNNLKAIFFLCGNYLKENQLVQRMIDEGHIIGNHTDKHKDLPLLSEQAIQKDIADFSSKIKEQYGKEDIKFFRPPQGRFDERTLKIAKEQSLRAMLWSIAIVDWKKEPMDDVAAKDKVLSRLHKGAVILFHITNAGTPKMLRQLLPELSEKGYTVGSPYDL